MSEHPSPRVERACRDLTAAGRPITFDAVAEHASIGRATLYRRPELRALVEEHRQSAREAHTLTGLHTQIDQLRHTLDALADKTRRQEERLRRLEHRTNQR